MLEKTLCGGKMDKQLIVQKYCERKGVPFEFTEENFKDLTKKIDGTLRLIKYTEKSYIAMYNSFPGLIDHNYAIKDIIKILDIVTKCREVEECSVCYEPCSVDLFKCATCSVNTCPDCLEADMYERSRSDIDKMISSGVDEDIILEMLRQQKSQCPVCRTKYELVELISSRINQ